MMQPVLFDLTLNLTNNYFTYKTKQLISMTKNIDFQLQSFNLIFSFLKNC